jgi:3-oxoadipate enol-lactonase
LIEPIPSSDNANLHYAQVPHGRIYYQIRGKGPALVFIHGFCLDHRMWAFQFDFFSAHYTTIAIDLRGFGNSSVPSENPYSHHEDIKLVLDQLGITRPAILIGNSMGGRIVLDFALCYPARTRAIVFVDGVLGGYSFKDFDLTYIHKIGREQGIDKANKLWLEHPLFQHARVNAAATALLQEMIHAYSGWHWINKNPVEWLKPPAMEQLSNLLMPVLIIIGQYDIQDFRDIANLMQEKIAHSIKKEIAGAGHMSNMEQDEDFNEEVVAFLNGLEIK